MNRKAQALNILFGVMMATILSLTVLLMFMSFFYKFDVVNESPEFDYIDTSPFQKYKTETHLNTLKENTDSLQKDIYKNNTQSDASTISDLGLQIFGALKLAKDTPAIIKTVAEEENTNTSYAIDPLLLGFFITCVILLVVLLIISLFTGLR